MIIRNWIPASAGMTVCEAHEQWDNTVWFTTLVCPHRVMPVGTRIRGLCRFLDTRLRGYDGVGCALAIGQHRWRHDPPLS